MGSASNAAVAARDWLDRRGVNVATLRQGFDWAYGKAVAGLPGLDGAAALAARYAARHGDADAAVGALIARQSGLAGASGFVTGCGGFVALPIALPANIAGALYIQARLVAAIAHLRGHDIASAEVRALALACLAGAKAADTVKDAGVRLGVRVARDGVGWAAPAMFRKVQHAAVPVACGAARSGRLVPLVGGVVAGGFDAAMTQLIGRTADRVFPPRSDQTGGIQERPAATCCPPQPKAEATTGSVRDSRVAGASAPSTRAPIWLRWMPISASERSSSDISS